MNIIVGRNGKSTVKNIVAEVDATVEAQFTLKSGKKVWRKDFIKQGRGYRPSASGVTIRWATAVDIPVNGVEYNTAEAILNASNKPKARKLMAEAGVSIPETTTDLNEALGWLRDGAVIARPKKHHGGLNFNVCHVATTLGTFVGDFYYQKVIRKTKEFRAHIAHGKVLVMQEKKPREGVTVDFDDVRPWNHATGEFIFETVDRGDYNVEVCKEAIKSVNAMGLDYGAVDIICDDAPYVVEVNTSPSLSDYSLSRYVKYFNWLGRKEEYREHWDSSEFTNGRSFAWKNFQLADEEE